MRPLLLALPLLTACARSTSLREPSSEGDDPRTVERRPGGADIAGARELDQQGVRSYLEGRYMDAVRLFRASYEAGGPPTELWNIARSREKLDEPEAAAQALQDFLSTSSLLPADRADAERELRALEARPSNLIVVSRPEGAAVLVDGKPEGTTPATFELRPGPHTVSLHRSGYDDEARSVEARFGRALVVTLDLKSTGK